MQSISIYYVFVDIYVIFFQNAMRIKKFFLNHLLDYIIKKAKSQYIFYASL